MKPLLVLNFKNFPESTGVNAVKLARVCERFARKSKKFQLVLCPSFTDLPIVAKVVSCCQVFSQHVDPVELGAFTGSFSVPLAKQHCIGTLLNHSERKLSNRVLQKTIELCKKHGFKTLVCVDSIAEARETALFHPDFIALEPPELIGKGISVSTSQPKLITAALRAVNGVNPNLSVLVGAGVSNADDVFRSLELGSNGVLVASAFAKNKNPRKWLASLG